MAKKRNKSAAASSVPIRNRIKEHRRVRAGDLIPNKANFRRHPKHQKDALLGLYQEVGFARSLLVFETPAGKLKLIDGHLRADIDPDMIVNCEILDVTEAEAKILLASMDPLAALAQNDKEDLEKLLREITAEDERVRVMFDAIARENDINLADGFGGLTDPDDVPGLGDAASTQLGDLWILGNHRLLCGNSAESTQVDRLLAGAVIHLVNTDPPYNVRVEPRSNNAIAAGLSSFPAPSKSGHDALRHADDGKHHHQSFDLARHPEKSQPTTNKLRPKDRPLTNDFMTDEAFDEMLHAWFGNLARVLVPGGSFYIWGGYANLGNYPAVLKECGLYFSQGIVWNKLHPVLTRKDFMGCYELAFYGWKEGAGHQFYGPNNAYDLWDIKKINPQNMVHLTEKPTELATRAMEYSSRPGQNVLDLFGGSGSTLIAAEMTGRRAYLMELDQLYADVIVRRYVKFAGPGKVLLSSDDGKLIPYEEVLAMRPKTAPPSPVQENADLITPTFAPAAS